MSRCFPFPPPGYEKKIRTDETNSLIKEKQKKEKKHKKDKDKEKKEGKEKKDKETSKEKHKEQKEKKEKHKDRGKRKSRTSEDKKSADVLPNTGDTGELVTNSFQKNGHGESKFIEDLARRIRDVEATDSQSVGKISFPCGGVTGNKISCPIPQTNHKKDDENQFNNTHRNFAMETESENAESSCTDQKGVEVTVKPVERKDQAKKMELQEKNHRRESVTKSDKPLDREGIKKSEPKYTTHRSRKEEKTEAINKAGQDKLKFVEGGPRLKDREHDFTTEADIGKRKDLETNGLLYENASRPNKIQRPVASPILSVENGRKLCQTPQKPVPDLQVRVCNPELKEYRINGFIDSKEPKSHPPASSVKVKENGEACAKKRPHSDLKYLDQILNVPKREKWADENEEQEWLFGQCGVKLKKPKSDSTTSLDETLQVWNQARRIESADTVALPYVVPL